MVIITGPAGRSTARTPGEVRAQLTRQRAKRDEALNQAREASVMDAAKAGQEIIRLRTLEGQDYQRRKFGPYTEDYAKQKGVSPSSVDLQDTGDFLGSLHITKLGKCRVKLEFAGPRMKRRAQGLASGRWPVYGKWTAMQRPRRRAMGFENSQDSNEINRRAWRAFQREMRRVLRHV